MSGCRVEIDLNATVIEVHSHVRITLRRFDKGCVQRGAPDRVDAVIRIDIVGAEVQRAGFIVNHPATHRDGMSQNFIRDTDLFERMNAPRRNRQIDRPPANDIAFARIGSSLVKIDIVATAPQVRGEQSARQTASDENEFRHDSESTNQEARKTGKGLSGFLINSLLSGIFEFARAREPNVSDCTNCRCVIDAV